MRRTFSGRPDSNPGRSLTRADGVDPQTPSHHVGGAQNLAGPFADVHEACGGSNLAPVDHAVGTQSTPATLPTGAAYPSVSATSDAITAKA